jgi:selenocysteine lyase/cysteine desulfurase
MAVTGTLENYFAAFRENVVGLEQTFMSPLGEKQILYADWTASGRAYRPIENYLQTEILPYMANTHSGSNITADTITKAYRESKKIIKRHVNATDEDALIFCGSGMTAAVNKLQRILGLRIPERLKDYLLAGSNLLIDENLRPVVFVTHMEHHSNHTSWLETIATVEIIRPDKNGKPDLNHFRELLAHYRHRSHKIAAVTACSNVTGIETPYHEIARLIHVQGGLCFVDFAASAPYVTMDMHPQETGGHLDAIYFSMHKFLGGPGTPGILIFNQKIYKNQIPDQPGGGTLAYSNPWKEHLYINSIEEREDGGTPPILQGIKAGQCILLKESMGTGNIRRREKELLDIIFKRFARIKDAVVLENKVKDRLGVVSFNIGGLHYDWVVQELNDRFSIQVRGGCSCAGSYGHYLLHIGQEESCRVRQEIATGDQSGKPGWVRLSLHPVMTKAEIERIMDAIAELAAL